MKIIDAHIHYRPDYAPFAQVAAHSGHTYTKDGIRQMMEDNDICHAIVMGNFEPTVENHQYPPYLSFCVGLDSNVFQPERAEEFLVQVEENLKRPNCVGLKLYPGYNPFFVTDEIYTPFYQLAEKYHKPVAIHTGAVASSKPGALLKYSHPLTLDELAVRFPDITFVMCHFGNPFLAEAAAVAEKNKNIIIDLSGILEGMFSPAPFMEENRFYVETVKMWLRYVGDYNRMVFGTDFPIVQVPSYIQFVKELIPKEAWHKVFYENAVRVYGLRLEQREGCGRG